jgi:F0F1-type ATP synthase assembly protein I
MPPDRRPVTPVGFALIGSEMVGFTLLGVAIDWLAGTSPWATVTLTVLGLLAAMVHLGLMVKVASAAKSDRPPGGNSP